MKYLGTPLPKPNSNPVKNEAKLILSEKKTDENKPKKEKERGSMKKIKTQNIWTHAEEVELKKYINIFGTDSWGFCAAGLGTRTDKQCKEKWSSAFNPKFKRGFWALEEQLLIFHEIKMGRFSWVRISSRLKNRSNTAVRNYFYNSLEKIKDSTFFELFRKILISKGDPYFLSFGFFAIFEIE